MRLLIIGIDGATWNVLDDDVLNNHMPNLHRLQNLGSWGVLRSCDPPITPAAWTTCITGCQPYTHGVVGFRDYAFKTNNLSISTADSCRVPTLWEHLSDQHYTVASINVPWTYPCRPVNGVIVAGYGVPGMNADFSYPKAFGKELLNAIPDYDILADWTHGDMNDMALLDKNISEIENRFRQRVRAAQFAAEKFNPDVMMVQFQNTDLLQHFAYSWVDRNTRDRYPQQRDRIFKMFGDLDQCIGDLLKTAGGHDLHIAIVSDHGLCRMRGMIRPNALLYQWGYLQPKPVIHRMLRRMHRNVQKLTPAKKQRMNLELKTPVNWKKSKAMVVYPALLGHIYLNVKGRNKDGCVDPGREYHAIIEDLRNRFSALKDPQTHQPVFESVQTPAERYGTDNPDPQIVGDLILVPAQGYIVHQSASRKAEPVKIVPDDSVAGCHCYEGIYLFSGPNVKQGRNKTAHIVDVAPTLYALLGAKVPDYIDGKPLLHLFEKSVQVDRLHTDAVHIRKQHELSENEQLLIQQKLSELGYMD